MEFRMRSASKTTLSEALDLRVGCFLLEELVVQIVNDLAGI